jgi:hypothetical protein
MPETFKAGRNHPCPCGSGKNFKVCHGNPVGINPWQPNPHIADLLMNQAAAREKQREKQQGLGKPIVSVSIGNRRLVAVAQKVFSSSSWRTFHDFLITYLHSVFGQDWFKAETRRPLESRHPLLNGLDRAKEVAE